LVVPAAAAFYRASGLVLWRKADIPFEIVGTSDKKVDGNGMRMGAIADSGPATEHRRFIRAACASRSDL
jgi:hypothetical protein